MERILIKSSRLNCLHLHSQYYTNNMIIATIASVSSALVLLSGGASMASSYLSFTFHTQYLLNKEQIGCFLKIWMIGASLCIFALITLYVIDDAIIHRSEEVAYGPTRNFYIAQVLGHNGTDLADLTAFILVCVELIYYGVLLYLYVAGLKQVIVFPSDRSVFMRQVFITFR